MKTLSPWFLTLVLAALGPHAFAQEKVWRCGNEYTNTRPMRKSAAAR